MHIGNSQTQSYGYNQNVNVANKNDSSNSFNNYLENKEENINTKKPTSNIIEYLDKKDKFSSLSKEDEILFKDILSDGVYSADEMKKLSYEQMNKFAELVDPKNLIKEHGSNSLNDLPPFILLGMGTYLSSNKTNDVNFNKSLFETTKNIQNNQERIDLLDSINRKLGLNDNEGYGNLPKEIIDNLIKKAQEMEKEKYKDFENPEKLMTDYNNWQINDYGGFIKNLQNDYKSLIKSSNVKLEDRIRYEAVLKNLFTLETNYNKVINEPKYA